MDPGQGYSWWCCHCVGKEEDPTIISDSSSKHSSVLLALGTGLLWLKTMKESLAPFPKELGKSTF